MATLRQYRDGGFYIHRGYPIRSDSEPEDLIHTTIQALPRAQAFFEEAEYRDASKIEPEVFYGLLLDGDLSSPSILRKKPTVHNIPEEMRRFLEMMAASKEWVSRFGRKEILRCRCLVDYFRYFDRITPIVERRSIAVHCCLFGHFQQSRILR